MIKCTYGDLDKLRDAPGRMGPMLKLMTATEPSIVDKFRIARLTEAIDAEFRIYGRSLEELGKKYGEPVVVEGKTSFKITPDKIAEFNAEKGALDAVECELPANPLPFSAYEKVSLTALDLSLLQKFCTPPPNDL